ncbi:YqfQ family protein [Bacillus sp. ISL-41]|uniref:YqfQ family protein n=1 Tax=Bacillus sp. ISL-41 TaxID=2819127 RepID=UPI002034C4B1|nr:YqfQ family protein [Bacillus sp. ISL-41]
MGQHQMYSNRFGPGPMMPQSQMPRMSGRNPRSRQGGGLLSKILGKGNSQRNSPSGLLSGGNTAARGAGSGGGILKTLADPSALNGFLTNTQKVLNTAQQFGPMIQQYGPLVRNLPSMWKLYRGLKDLPDAEEQTAETETNEKTEKKQKTKKSKRAGQTSPTQKKSAQKQSNNAASTPKLFI